MQFTSNSEYDLDKRVQLTNEIPPYCSYDGLNHVLQNAYWKWFLGSETVEFDCTKTGDVTASSEPIKIVNGVVSENYGPDFESVWDSDTNTYKKAAPTYHRLEINGAWLAEEDLFLHEIYRYMSYLYPDHPDYRKLLTENELTDAYIQAGKITKVPFNTDVVSLVALDRSSFSDDDALSEKAKMYQRHLLDFPVARKFAGSWYGYRIEGGDIFESISVYPVGSYLPMLPITKTDASADGTFNKSFWTGRDVDVQSRLLNHKVRLIDWEGDDILPYEKSVQTVSFIGWTVPGFNKSIFEYPHVLSGLSNSENIDTTYNLLSTANSLDTFVSKTYTDTPETLSTFAYDSESAELTATQGTGTNMVCRVGIGQQLSVKYLSGLVFENTEDLLAQSTYKDIVLGSMGYATENDYKAANYSNALAYLYKYCKIKDIAYSTAFTFTVHPFQKGTIILPPSEMMKLYATEVKDTITYDEEGKVSGFVSSAIATVPTDKAYPVIGKHLTFSSNYMDLVETYVYPTVYEVTGNTLGHVDITCSNLETPLADITDPSTLGSRMALIVKGDNGYVVLLGSMTMEFTYSNSLMQPSVAVFNIEAIPETKDSSMMTLIYGSGYADKYTATELTELQKNRELLLVNKGTSSETLSVYENCETFFACKYVNADKTGFFYSKVAEYSAGIVKNFDFGGISLLPLESNGTLATIPSTVGDSSLISNITSYKSGDYSLVYPSFKSIVKSSLTSYNAGYIEDDELDSLNNLYGTIKATQKETDRVQIEADLELGSATVRFSTDDAIYKMRTLSVGDTLSGFGIPSGSYITEIGYNSVTINANALISGSFLLSFEVVYLSIAQDIDRNTYYIQQNKSLNTYTNKNPFNTGFYESGNFPYTSKAMVEGALFPKTAVSQMINEVGFLPLVQAFHEAEYPEVAAGTSYCLPSILSTKTDTFVEVNLNHLIKRASGGTEYLMLHEYLDYLQSELSYINRKTDRISVGTNITMETDRSGFYTSLQGIRYTDPGIKLRFITRDWKDDTVPYYAQIGTGGSGRASWFKSSQDISYPDIWGAGYYDGINKGMAQEIVDLEADGGLLQKRNYWRDKNSYRTTSDDLDDNLSDYKSVEDPLFEIPLGEYDVIKDYQVNTRTTTLVQCSFIKQEVSGSITDKTLALTTSDFLSSKIFYEIGNLESGNAMIKKFSSDVFAKPVNKGFFTLEVENGAYTKPSVTGISDSSPNMYYWIASNSATISGKLYGKGAVITYYKGTWAIRNLQNFGVYGVLSQGGSDLALSEYSYSASRTKAGTLLDAIEYKVAASSQAVSANEIEKYREYKDGAYYADGATLFSVAWNRQSEHLDSSMIPYVICLPSTSSNAYALNKQYESYISAFCTVSDNYAIGLVDLGDAKSLIFININREIVAAQDLPSSTFINSNETSYLSGSTVYSSTFKKCGINLLLQNETTFTLPNGYITPSTLSFSMLVKCPVFANVLSASDYASGNTGNVISKDISGSAIYKDSTLDAFYIVENSTRYYINFNENKFFKNVVFIMGNYYTLDTTDTAGETTSNIIIEKIDGVPFDSTSLLADDKVLAFEEIYLRSTGSENIAMKAFCDSATLNSRIYGVDETGNVFLVNPKNIWNASEASSFGIKLTQWMPLSNRVEDMVFPYTAKGNTFEQPSILNPEIAKPLASEGTTVDTSFKFFKNMLVVSGVITSSNPNFIKLQNTGALPYIESGDSIEEISYLSPLSSTFTKVKFIDSDTSNALVFQKLFYSDTTLVGVTENSQIWYNKEVSDLGSDGGEIPFTKSTGFPFFASNSGDEWAVTDICYNSKTEEFYISGTKEPKAVQSVVVATKDTLKSQFNALAISSRDTTGVNTSDAYLVGNYSMTDNVLTPEESYPYIQGDEIAYSKDPESITGNTGIVQYSSDNNLTFDVGGTDNDYPRYVGADNFTLMIMGDTCFVKSPVYRYASVSVADGVATVGGDSSLSEESYWKYAKIPVSVNGESEVMENTTSKAYELVNSLRGYYLEVVKQVADGMGTDTEEVTYPSGSTVTTFEFRSADVLDKIKAVLASVLTYAQFTAQATKEKITVSGYSIVTDYVPDHTSKYTFAYFGTDKTTTYTADTLVDGGYNYEHAYKEYLSDYVAYICMNTKESSFTSKGIQSIKVIGDRAYIILSNGGFICLDKDKTYQVSGLSDYSNWKRPTFPENTYYAGPITGDSSWFAAADIDVTDSMTGKVTKDYVAMKLPQKVCGAVCRTFAINYIKEVGNYIIATGYYKSKTEVESMITSAGLKTTDFTTVLSALSSTRKPCVLVADKTNLSFSTVVVTSVATAAGCPTEMSGKVHIPLIDTVTELTIPLDDGGNVDIENTAIVEADSTYQDAFSAESFPVEEEILFANEDKSEAVVLSEYAGISLTKSTVRNTSDSGIYLPESAFSLSSSSTVNVQVLLSINIAASVQNPIMFIDMANTNYFNNGTFKVSMVKEVSSYLEADSIYSYRELAGDEDDTYGYPALFEDKNKKYYSYDSDGNVEYYTNANGMKLALADSTGELILTERRTSSSGSYGATGYENLKTSTSFDTLPRMAKLSADIDNMSDSHGTTDTYKSLVSTISPKKVVEFNSSSSFIKMSTGMASASALKDYLVPVTSTTQDELTVKFANLYGVNLNQYTTDEDGKEVTAYEYLFESRNIDGSPYLYNKQMGCFIFKDQYGFYSNISFGFRNNATSIISNYVFNRDTTSHALLDTNEKTIYGIYIPSQGYGGHRYHTDKWLKDRPSGIDPDLFTEFDSVNSLGNKIYLVDSDGNKIIGREGIMEAKNGSTFSIPVSSLDSGEVHDIVLLKKNDDGTDVIKDTLSTQRNTSNTLHVVLGSDTGYLVNLDGNGVQNIVPAKVYYGLKDVTADCSFTYIVNEKETEGIELSGGFLKADISFLGETTEKDLTVEALYNGVTATGTIKLLKSDSDITRQEVLPVMFFDTDGTLVQGSSFQLVLDGTETVVADNGSVIDGVLYPVNDTSTSVTFSINGIKYAVSKISVPVLEYLTSMSEPVVGKEFKVFAVSGDVVVSGSWDGVSSDCFKTTFGEKAIETVFTFGEISNTLSYTPVVKTDYLSIDNPLISAARTVSVVTDKELYVRGISGVLYLKFPRFKSLSTATASSLGFAIPYTTRVYTNNISLDVVETGLISLTSELTGLRTGITNHILRLKILPKTSVELDVQSMNDSDHYEEIPLLDKDDYGYERIWWNPKGLPDSPMIVGDKFFNYENVDEFDMTASLKNKLNGTVHLCNEAGEYIGYKLVNNAKTEFTLGTDGDLTLNVTATKDDRRQIWNPTYQSCQEWYEDAFYLADSEKNPFWQKVVLKENWDEKQKTMVENVSTVEFGKQGGKIVELETSNPHLSITKSVIPNKYSSDYHFDKWLFYTDKADGEVTFTSRVSDSYIGEQNLLKYGISATNGLYANEANGTYSAVPLDADYSYEFGSLPSCLNNKDTVTITEFGLFDKDHNIIAYAVFPPVEVSINKGQHLSFTCSISKDTLIQKE